MSVDNHTRTRGERAPAAIVIAPPGHHRRFRRSRTPRRPRPRVRKLRLLFVLTAFGALAVISALFGALTSIASDLPKFENQIQFSGVSYMYDIHGNPIGPLAPASTPAIDKWGQISRYMRDAIVAVEDRGFWHESGISVRGLARAALADATGGKLEGASTIPEEFIKNVRTEEGDRTIAEKLVEAGMAFQLSHHWTHQQILTEYLNTIYFGNGALGIEAAARVYFGWNHGYDAANPVEGGPNSCGDADPVHPRRQECAAVLKPAEAALLAGIVANPSAFNPAGNSSERNAAKARRNLVLDDMYQQHYISYQQYQDGRDTKLPTPAQIEQPEQQPSAAPYFTSWVEPQVVHALEREGLSAKQAQYEAEYGGLKIRLSIDLDMQRQAQTVVHNELFTTTGLPSASLVAIDNKTGEVRAMVSGDGNYEQSPFNLATMGYRQPGSSFKIFTLAAALQSGAASPYSEYDSEPITIHFVKTHTKNPYRGNAYAADNGTGHFHVRNFGNEYDGPITLSTATAISDNSFFAQLGTKIGTAAIAHYARKLGIRTPISRNPSMILGGLSHGVSALDMAHAYASVANDGEKVFNSTLGDPGGGPIGIDSISGCQPCKLYGRPEPTTTNKATMSEHPVISSETAATIDELLHGPVDDPGGTGTAAAIPGVEVVGKTGTTSNYVDAWFVGWTPQLTVAVWVGYPDSGQPMTTQFDGGPVEGGTYPAIIWRNFMVSALQIIQDEEEHKQAAADSVTTATSTYTSSATSASTTTPTTDSTSTSTSANGVQTAPAATQQTQGPDDTGASGSASGSATGSAITGGSTPSSSSNGTETLPQSNAPVAPTGSDTGATSGGSGL